MGHPQPLQNESPARERQPVKRFLKTAFYLALSIATLVFGMWLGLKILWSFV
jgi:hypothetical protein